MIGRDKSRTYWKVLKIDRQDPSELNIREDSTTYTELECSDLLRRIHEGNKSIGGLKFITTCYGIVGFVKFLGPYYMLLITERRQIGAICGHSVYAVSKSEMIPLSNSAFRASITDSKNENRYKKLLCTVDLTKDFFFSYSYHVMRSLQKNMCTSTSGHVLYETMFVWNEFLTRGIRNHLQNTVWTVALVYGFFKQASLSASGRDFKLTLIARRSRHYAGTRFLGHFQPQQGKPALWELDSDQHYDSGRDRDDGRSIFQRSLSDGNILHQCISPTSARNGKQDKFSDSVLPEESQDKKVLSESSPEISTCESDITNYSRYTPSMPRRQLFGDIQRDRGHENDQVYFVEHDMSNFSNFLDLDWLSSSGNSCEEEPYERSSMLTSSPIEGLSSENVINGIMGESTPSTSECGSTSKERERTEAEADVVYGRRSNVLEEYSDSFVHWVDYGETLCH
uniref:SAC domain-containing protein n=1 Tax=Cannabis sativa TaxID=3483 RepID=A0A803NUW5_CANSA